MADDIEPIDALRPEYDVSQLTGGVRGKYSQRCNSASNRALLYIAIACGALPMTIGSAIFFAWLVTRWSWLEGAGVINIFAGLLLFLIGVVTLCVYLARERRRPNSSAKRWAVLAGGLLLANFPAAAVYGFAVIYIMSHYHVLVINESGETIDSFMLRSPGLEIELGPLRPGATRSRYLSFPTEGTLDFAARQQQLRFGGEIEGYVTGNMDGDTTVHVKHGGEFDVRRNTRIP